MYTKIVFSAVLNPSSDLSDLSGLSSLYTNPASISITCCIMVTLFTVVFFPSCEVWIYTLHDVIFLATLIQEA